MNNVIDPNSGDTTRVVVAMSGGVDSSLAAVLVAQSGLSAIGVSMQVWDYRKGGGCSSKATCCAPSDFLDARRAADVAGIPYYVVDFENTFREEVIDKFVNSYAAGLTPNPCIDCNNKVKFLELRRRAASMGCSHVATGHYARIEKQGDVYHLLRGVDRDKDQTYFLYGISQEELAHTLFPIGHLTKPEVRELAREAGLTSAEKAESQDICFISGSVQDFIAARVPSIQRGLIRRTTGEIVGTHEGVHRFTVGQRRGVHGGGSGDPLYVLAVEPETGTVYVGRKSELELVSFVIGEVTWVLGGLASQIRTLGALEVRVQVRHRHRAVRVRLTLEHDSSDRLRATFLDEPATVAPGQAAVFYDLDDKEVLGGGRIARVGASFEASTPITAATRIESSDKVDKARQGA